MLDRGDNGLENGEVYDIIFDSETSFYLRVADGPRWHVQVPYDITASPSDGYPYTIIKGELVFWSEPRETPPYTLDANCKWVLDTQSGKICWISLGICGGEMVIIFGLVHRWSWSGMMVL